MYVELTLPNKYIHIWVHVSVTINEYAINGYVLIGGELYCVISRHLCIQIRIGNEITAGLGHPMCL